MSLEYSTLPRKPWYLRITLKRMELMMIRKTLNHFKNNRSRAAQSLGIPVRTLRDKLKRYKEKGIEV
jgi:DNA-binding NtrC family response regulator